MQHSLFTAGIVTLFSWAALAESREYLVTFGQYLDYEDLATTSLDASELIDSPLIVVGAVEGLTFAGSDLLRERVDPEIIRSQGARVDVFEASVAVERVVTGKIEKQKIAVETYLMTREEDAPFDLQMLLAKKSYAFFLTPGDHDIAWKGVYPMGFALRVETPTPGAQQGLSAAESLRRIAHANIREADQRCAEKWFEFLTELYDPERDYGLCLATKDDFRPRIRGFALSLLCEHHPETENLYEDARAYVRDWMLPRDHRFPRLRDQISERLYAPLAHHRPDAIDDELRAWLRDDIPLMRAAAVATIGAERRTSLLPDMVDYLEQIEARLAEDLVTYRGYEESIRNSIRSSQSKQYACYKTLCKLTRKNYTAYKPFCEQPQAYLEEFRRHGTAKAD